MSYTVKQLAELSGVTARTLRWYDRMGLLVPQRQENGYRLYDGDAVERLQEILLYRELDMALPDIKRLLDAPNHDRERALHEHLEALTAKRDRLNAILSTVKQTIDEIEGGTTMTDQAKFEAFKRQAVAENERRYGAEVREKYGAKAAEEGNQAMMGMDKATYDRWEQLGREIVSGLAEAKKRGDAPSSPEVRALADKHLAWLKLVMARYDRTMQKGLTQMYVEDERFKAHYDSEVEGCAELLRDAVAAMEE